MVKINSHFIANFNKGRNIVRNLETLSLLYRLSNAASEDDKALLRKPIVVLIASIAEAVMYDFHYRTHSFTREIKSALSSSKIFSMTKNDTDEFKALIGKFQANNILEIKGVQLYDDLHLLRRLRNRVHIQNSANEFEEYESEVFTPARITESERTLEKLLNIMTTRYGRGEHLKYVDDFVLPWNSHF